MSDFAEHRESADRPFQSAKSFLNDKDLSPPVLSNNLGDIADMTLSPAGTLGPIEIEIMVCE